MTVTELMFPASAVSLPKDLFDIYNYVYRCGTQRFVSVGCYNTSCNIDKKPLKIMSQAIRKIYL